MREGNVGAPARATSSPGRLPARAPRPRAWRNCRLRRRTSGLLDPLHAEARGGDDVDEQRAEGAAAVHERRGEGGEARRFDLGGGAPQGVANELARGAVVDDAAPAERLGEGDGAVEGAVDVGAGDDAGGVDG